MKKRRSSKKSDVKSQQLIWIRNYLISLVKIIYNRFKRSIAFLFMLIDQWIRGCSFEEEIGLMILTMKRESILYRRIKLQENSKIRMKYLQANMVVLWKDLWLWEKQRNYNYASIIMIHQILSKSTPTQILITIKRLSLMLVQLMIQN